jgi:hypothetical protein
MIQTATIRHGWQTWKFGVRGVQFLRQGAGSNSPGRAPEMTSPIPLFFLSVKELRFSKCLDSVHETSMIEEDTQGESTPILDGHSVNEDGGNDD